MTKKPVRIQRKRVKGWRMQEAAGNGLVSVYVGRPSRWGNPYKDSDPDVAVAMFAFRLRATPGLIATVKRELRGKNLCCWCSKVYGAAGNRELCHGDILLKIANEEEEG